MVRETFDTEYCADSVEFCPWVTGLAAVGTYQVVEDECSDGITVRKGRILLYQTGITNTLLIQCIETEAILDLQWIENKILIAVSATGETSSYKLKDVISGLIKDKVLILVSSLRKNKVGVLNLSVDWDNRLNSSNSRNDLIISRSDGFLELISTTDSCLIAKREWKAHDFEAWISSFNQHNSDTVFSGGDDSLFKVWDLRSDMTTAVASKAHESGVTSISSHPTKENILVTGSYDEMIRVWDNRSYKAPISSINTGGGVWRLKWKPDGAYLLSACMYNGFHIYNFESETLCHVEEYKGHKSIAYGADWSGIRSLSGDIIGTCSFYDHSYHLWDFKML